eukprot:m.56163 g.56163  ORF g.56163 m.56163 type:complete len:545 (-) comp15682_c0_seq2:29-1663(-)
MCGIFAIFNHQGTDTRKIAMHGAARQRHRGPDWSGARVFQSKADPTVNHALSHERLMIVGLKEGWQPFYDGKLSVTVNGEIYNHTDLRTQFSEYKFESDSDCEVILPLYSKYGCATAQQLDGMFSFALYDETKDEHYVARDPMGITSLYHGYTASGAHVFASELKALTDQCESIEVFRPGHYYSSKDDKFVCYYQPVWRDEQYLPTQTPDLTAIKNSFVKAVKKRMMADVPYGVLLSGGLDSSLVASVASRLHRETHPDHKLKSFAVGLFGAPDLAAAQKVADFLQTDHHSFHFTIQDGLDALPDVIYHLETYDVTTIRASTPMFLLSRKIKSLGVKMVLSGEGSDEIFGGYLYFHKAPSAQDLHRETVKRVFNLHTSDCLRANKSTMAWGLEARVPFLDREFLDVCMTFDPEAKMHVDKEGNKRMEKHVLRSAFDCEETPYLPKDMLWRQKEQFSDGVGYSWIDSLKAVAETNVTERQLQQAAARFPFDPPKTKEAYYYRQLFETIFPKQTVASTVVNWVPKQEWGCSADPSGRAQDVHVQRL